MYCVYNSSVLLLNILNVIGLVYTDRLVRVQVLYLLLRLVKSFSVKSTLIKETDLVLGSCTKQSV